MRTGTTTSDVNAHPFLDDVDRDKISAGVANGILTITIPKTTPEQEAKVMRNIEVK